MNVLLKNGYVETYAIVGQVTGGIDVTDFDNEKDLEEFRKYHTAYRLSNNNSLELDMEKLAQLIDEKEIETLRERRADECFPIINRGALWYADLTESQKTELSDWYHMWLDVTETHIVPTAPTWLK